MNAPAAFRASFADFKLVKTRKTAQLIFEVPLEGADAALNALGGVPRPDAECWVAIARIDPKAASEAPKPIVEPSERERRKWDELRPSQQAAIRSKEPSFQRFMWDVYKNEMGYNNSSNNDDAVAQIVRHLCGVKSRADILPGTRAAEKWSQIDNDYWAYLRYGP